MSAWRAFAAGQRREFIKSRRVVVLRAAPV
jgi:hypothetical protein